MLEKLSAAAKYRLRWRLKARPNQLTPPGIWLVWMILAGRGWGKTNTGAEDVALYAQQNPGSRIAIVAPTFADGRDTCIEGETGLLNSLPAEDVKTWNRSMGQLLLTNGSRFQVFSAEEPDRLRGPQHHRAWCDELAAWKYPQQTWDQLMFGLRLGSDPRTIVTTTPRPIKLVRELRKRDDVYLTVGSTFDNADNLAPSMLAELRNRYEGTRLGRQELNAEILEDIPGALWTLAMLDDHRVKDVPRKRELVNHEWEMLPDLGRVVVSVDPAVTSGEDSDETGIIVVGKGSDHHAYVIADYSGRYTPAEWASKVVEAFHAHQADRVVAEVNNGGDLVVHTVATVDPRVPVKKISASRGKKKRAEPVSALAEQGRIHHVGSFPKLEEQLTTWTEDTNDVRDDRLDAMVHGVTELMLGAERRKLRFTGVA